MIHAAGPLDTDVDVDARLVERWRACSAAERAHMVERLCADVERLARSQIMAERPGLAELQIRHELARRRYGAALADAAYGHPLQRE